MIQIDGVSTMGLTIDDILSMNRNRVSDVDQFCEFAKGIQIDDEFLFNERWSKSGAIPEGNSIDFVMHEMLSAVYDVDVLEKMGGSFSFRITGVGDYTLISLNNRVVTLSGLPIDVETNNEILNCEVFPDVFMGFCRGLLLDVADEILIKDDEFERRIISDGELVFNGMPSGGLDERPDRDFGHSIADVRTRNFGTFDRDGQATGTISHHGDKDWHAIDLQAHRYYDVKLKGSPSGKGTLTDPYLRGIYDADGKQVHKGNDDSGHETESTLLFKPLKDGIYYVSAGAYGIKTGTYTMSVAPTNNYAVCYAAQGASSGPHYVAGASGYACGFAASYSVMSITGVSGYMCGGNFSAIGASAIGVSVGGCGANAVAIGLLGCGANASACGANAMVAGSGGCLANASGCTVNAMASLVSGCGANASVCSVAVGAGSVLGCGANASACVADINILPCAAYTVSCGVDLGSGVDFGSCAINIFPLLPSC